MHHAARRFFNAIHPEIQYYGGCAVRIGSGIKLHLGSVTSLPSRRTVMVAVSFSVRCSSYMTSSAVKQKCLLTDMISSFTCRPDAWLFWVFTLEVINDLAGHSAAAGHKYQQQDKAQHKIHQAPAAITKKRCHGLASTKLLPSPSGGTREHADHRYAQKQRQLLLFRRFCPPLLVRSSDSSGVSPARLL